MRGRALTESGLQRAFDVEIRIVANDQEVPVWSQNPDAAEHWIYEIVQGVFRNVLGGIVQLEQDFVEPTSLDQTLGVFAVPSSANRSIVSGDTQAIASRIEDNLRSKFGASVRKPFVRIDPCAGFLEVSAYAGENPLSVVHPEARATPPTYMAMPGGPGGYSRANDPPPARQGLPGSALLWMGAALGGMLIASAFLLNNGMALQRQNETLLAAQSAHGERERELLGQLASANKQIDQIKYQGRTYIRELELHIANLDSQIVDLLNQKTPRPPPVLVKPSPPSPDPFVDTNPDPFASLRAQD